MRLYLSSFRVGAHPERLLSMAAGVRRIAVVANALDAESAAVRATGVRRELNDLSRLGFEPVEVDVRSAGIDVLADFRSVWVRGGNVFVLRRALADSGADGLLSGLIRQDALLYAAYSAGACVLAGDLDALACVDDPGAVGVPIMTGLGILDRPFVPHVRSLEHPESAACDDVAAAYAAAGRPHWALRDGQVLVVDGDRIELLS